MILPLVILYVVTLVYLSITERFRNFASLIGLQGWLLFAIALVRLHAINPAELAFIAIETLLFKGILVPALLFAHRVCPLRDPARDAGACRCGAGQEAGQSGRGRRRLSPEPLI